MTLPDRIWAKHDAGSTDTDSGVWFYRQLFDEDNMVEFVRTNTVHTKEEVAGLVEALEWIKARSSRGFAAVPQDVETVVNEALEKWRNR